MSDRRRVALVDRVAGRARLDRLFEPKAAGFPFGVTGGQGAAVTPISYTANGAVAGTGTSASQSFASVPFGTADATRLVVVFILWSTGTTVRTLLSVTISGVAGTIIVQKTPNAGNGGAGIAICSALVPTGTSGTVAATFSAGLVTTPQCYAYSIYNATSNTARGTDSGNSSTSQTSDTMHPSAASAPRLVGLVGACFQNSSVTNTWAETNDSLPLAEDIDTSPVSGFSYSTASGVMDNAPAGGLSMQDTFSGTQAGWKYAMAAVTFA